MGRTVLESAVDFGLININRDNGSCTSVSGTLQCARTNTTTTNDRNHVTRLDARAVRGGTKARGDAARDERSGSQVVPRVNANQ